MKERSFYPPKDQSRIPSIKTEIPDVTYGREFLPVIPMDSWSPDENVLEMINALNSTNTDSQTIRSIVTSKMNNNTAYTRNPMAFERPVSAYFTYKPAETVVTSDSMVTDEAVVIEWGVIDPKSKVAKLHDVLNNSIPGIKERPKNGMKLSSGHIAKFTETNGYIALFDELGPKDTAIEKNSPMGKMINTLYAHNIIPINGQGYIVLPAFLEHTQQSSHNNHETTYANTPKENIVFDASKI